MEGAGAFRLVSVLSAPVLICHRTVANEPATLPWSPPDVARTELHLTLEDATLCLRNSDRLRRDSRGRTLGTRLALLELALEEVAKGNMILIRTEIQKAPGPSRLGAESAPPDSIQGRLRALLLAKMHLFTDDALREAFWNHDIKLEFVEFLIDLVELLLPIISASDPDVSNYPARYRLMAGFGSLPPVKRFTIAQLRETFVKLKQLGFESLDTAAKRGLFVDPQPQDRSASKSGSRHGFDLGRLVACDDAPNAYRRC